MPRFRGNVGNLLQHWVLCELLEILRDKSKRIDFIDAFSMAPMADERPKLDATAHVFDYVQARLPGEDTAYERAWQALVSAPGKYPNSASFLTTVWPRQSSLLLCESEPTTVQQLRAWARGATRGANVIDADVWGGDWRVGFRRGVSTSGELTLFSFDPYMFDRHGSGRNAGNLDPSDLDLLAATLDSVCGHVLVQLSTYSANNDNPQSAVTEVVTSRLSHVGLELLAAVRADGNMMSLVLGRDVKKAAIAALPARFECWLARAKAECKRATSGGV